MFYTGFLFCVRTVVESKGQVLLGGVFQTIRRREKCGGTEYREKGLGNSFSRLVFSLTWSRVL